MANKVEFGISELHVGTYEDNNGTVTLGTPYHQKGAISYAPEEETNENVLNADNSAYWSQYSGGKISGDLTVAMFDDKFKKDFLGYVELSDGGLAKVKNAVKPNVYIAFQIEGDAESRRVILFNGSLGAIKRDYNTTTESIEPDTETLGTTFIGDAETGVTIATYKPGDAGYDDLFTNPAAPDIESES